MDKEEKKDIILIIACGIILLLGITIKDIILTISSVGLLNAYLLSMIYTKLKK